MNDTPAQAIDKPASPPDPIPMWDAILFWLKLGFISFGGPAGQIAIMHHELVERRRWISEKRFLHALNYCMVLPGPEAQQLATYIGWLMHRTAGGIIAGVLFVLPSLFLLIALSAIYMAWGHTPWIAGVFDGIKPAVTAIVLHAAHRIGSRSLKNKLLWSIAVASFGATFLLNAPFPLIVLAAALIGHIGGRLSPHSFSAGASHGSAQSSYGPAVIDDHTPTPEHARFSWKKAGKVTATGALLWAAPMGLLIKFFGWAHALPQMGWFFTKAALLTFGGAYAVLPYVYDGAVNHHGWATAGQMMDGLALGETTPGPLIMVVAFVGFVGGWSQALWGPDQLFMAGAVAACVVTWFTFLPSFVFILLGGPFIESTHNNIRLTAPLAAITAAVVGVILNLALFFAYHVIWPQGAGEPHDWSALLIAVAATLGLFWWKRSVIEIIACAGIAGLLIKLLA